MLEGWGDNLDQKQYISALEFGAIEAYKVVESIKSSSFEKKTSQKTAKEVAAKESSQSIEDLIKYKFQELGYSKLYDILTDYKHDKQSRDDAVSQVKNTIVNSLLKNELKLDAPSIYNYNSLSEMFTKFMKSVLRNLILEESKRVDGRKFDELRPISCKVGIITIALNNLLNKCCIFHTKNFFGTDVIASPLR